MPGMAWCYASDPNGVYRVEEGETWRRDRRNTRRPIASDPATAGCLWHLIQTSLRELYNGYTLELSYDHSRGCYLSTLYDTAGVAAFESSGGCSGRCAVLILHWLWFPPCSKR
jgi:hypothetical protein